MSNNYQILGQGATVGGGPQPVLVKGSDASPGQVIIASDSSDAYWGTVGGGGGSVIFAGDLSGTNTSQTVVGIDGYSINPLADGYLFYSGTNMSWQTITVPTSAITQLTGDVLAGPGSGSQAATVVNLTGSGGVIPHAAVIVGESGSSFPVSFGVSAISLSSDANYVLTAAQLINPLLRFTSSVSLTATRTITLPAQTGASYSVYNNTTGGQSLLFEASSGTGITVPNGLKTNLYFDGTNYVVNNILIGGDLSATSNISQKVVGIDGYSITPLADGYLYYNGSAMQWLAVPAVTSVPITGITGDAAFTGTTASGTITLDTVNSNTGSFGSATQVGTFTVNGKGLITAASNTAISGSGITLAADLGNTALLPNVVSITGPSGGVLPVGTSANPLTETTCTITDAYTVNTLFNALQTSSNSATTIHTIAVASNTVIFVNASILGVDGLNDGYVCSATLSFTAIRQTNFSAGALTLVPAVPAPSYITNLSGSSMVVSASVSSNNIIIQVTGLSSTTCRWQSMCQVQEVG